MFPKPHFWDLHRTSFKNETSKSSRKALPWMPWVAMPTPWRLDKPWQISFAKQVTRRTGGSWLVWGRGGGFIVVSGVKGYFKTSKHHHQHHHHHHHHHQHQQHHQQQQHHHHSPTTFLPTYLKKTKTQLPPWNPLPQTRRNICGWGSCLKGGFTVIHRVLILEIKSSLNLPANFNLKRMGVPWTSSPPP